MMIILDLMAPGTNILSLNDNSIDDTYHCTAFPSAIVSATAALMLSVNPSLFPADVERILYENYQWKGVQVWGDETEHQYTINGQNSQDMWSLRSELLGKSPHLSMEVLKSVTDRTDVFPDDILLEILSANPDELRNKELIEYIENSPDPLPDYMIEILKQVANGSTYKTALECQMSWLNSSRARNANDMIRSIKNEESVNHTSLRNWLDNLGGEAADIAIIKSFMEENNYTDAMSLANMLPQLYDYNADQLVEHDYFIDMIDLHHDLYQTNRNIFQLNSQEVAELYTIATTSNSTAGTEAKGILSALYGYHFCDCLEISDSTAYKSSQSVLFPEKVPTTLYDVSFNPNPASSWTNITYELPSIDSQAVLVIYDQYGREIERFNLEGQSGSFTWDTRSTESGIYIYRLFLNDESISGRIVIN